MPVATLPATQRDHDRAGTVLQSRQIRRQMEPAQLVLGDRGVSLVDLLSPAAMLVQFAKLVLMFLEGSPPLLSHHFRVGNVGSTPGRPPMGPAVCNEMLDASEHGPRVGQPRPVGVLETAQKGHPEFGHTVGVATNQIGITRRPQSDVVGEHGGSVDIGVAVNGIDAVEERHSQPRPERPLLEGTHHVGPGLRRIRLRIAAATGQHGTDPVLGDLVRRDAVLLHLGHLTDFLGQRHRGDEVRDGDAVAHLWQLLRDKKARVPAVETAGTRAESMAVTAPRRRPHHNRRPAGGSRRA